MQFVVVLKNGHQFTISQDEADDLDRLVREIRSGEDKLRLMNNRFIVRISEIVAVHPVEPGAAAMLVPCWNPFDFEEAFRRLQNSE